MCAGAGRYRLPAVVRIVDVGRIEIAGRDRHAGRAVVDPAGLGHRPVMSPLITAASFGAGDGDGHHLRGAVRGQRREGVGQRVAAVERLHVGIAVVERIGPHPGRVECVGAVAVGGGGAGRTACPGIVRSYRRRLH